MAAVATDTAGDGLRADANTRNDSNGLSSVSGPTSQAQYPSQQAEPDRELGSLCSSLQATAAAANNDLRQYLLAHSNQREIIVPLSRELVEIQTAARLYVRRCSVIGTSADGSGNQMLSRPVLDHLVTVVHQAGRLISDVMNLLETSSGGSVGREQESLSAEQLTARLSNVTATANICTSALNLGLDAIALGPALQYSPELPAYESTQLLEDILSLRLRISNLNSNESPESSTALPAVSEFLDRLQNHMGRGTTSLLVPPITESAAEPGQTRSDSVSLRSDPPQSSGLLQPGTHDASHSGQQSPAYDSVRVEHPAPASISLQHYSRKTFVDGEILSLAFVTKNGETFITANNMTAPTRFYPLHVGVPGQFTSSHGGGCLVFPPEGAPSTAWAYVTEDEPGAVASSSSSSASASPWQHDGTDFRKPVLCIGDFATNKRHQKVRQWGIRPLCFSRDGARLAVTNGRHRIALLDAAYQFALRPDEGLITSHTDTITHATFTPDAHALVSLSRDGTVRLTDPFSMEGLAKFDTGTWKAPALLGVTPDSNVVVSVWGGDLVYRWNHATGAVDSFALGGRRAREGWPVALSPDCRFLLCRNDEGADISDAHSGRLLFTVHFSRGFLTAAAFTADSKFLALGKATSWVGPKVLQSTLDIWRLEF